MHIGGRANNIAIIMQEPPSHKPRWWTGARARPLGARPPATPAPQTAARLRQQMAGGREGRARGGATLCTLWRAYALPCAQLSSSPGVDSSCPALHPCTPGRAGILPRDLAKKLMQESSCMRKKKRGQIKGESVLSIAPYPAPPAPPGAYASSGCALVRARERNQSMPWL